MSKAISFSNFIENYEIYKVTVVLFSFATGVSFRLN